MQVKNQKLYSNSAVVGLSQTSSRESDWPVWRYPERNESCDNFTGTIREDESG